jgi:eukaryotic-like serine/threonine-protein kinase
MAADSSERFVLLNRLADEFAARYRRGERPSLQEYLDRHPELADDIRAFFPTLVEMEQVKDDRQAPVAQAASRALPPLERLDDFRVIREVGRGGMGVVYEAEQVSLGRHVALKVLPKQLLADAQTKRRFQREARAAARLHHTNIVPVFGVGEHDGLSYYVMQFIPGLGLDAVLEELQRLQPGKPGSGSTPGLARGELRVARKDVSAAAVARSLLTGRFTPAAEKEGDAPAARGDATAAHDPGADADLAPPVATPDAGRLSDTFSLSSSSVVLPGAGRQPGQKQLTYWQGVARIGVQVADALEYAHRQGVLHRDIKPSNLLLDTTGTVWVTDFGLAKADDQQDLTHTGDILGTLRYMPPEAFDGKADARGDLYALGLTLYELLAFRPAFDEKERNPLIKQVTTAEPARLDRLNREVPRDLVTIVHKAIECDPAHRYPTAGALAADLQRFLADEPIQARRQTQRERFLRWARRNPGIAVLGGVLTAVLVLATVASLLAAGYFNRLRLNEAQAAQGERDARHEAEEAADEARRRGEAERWERYRSNIAAAAGALQLQNSGTARSALEAAPPEHRNWEWQYLHSQLDGASLVLPVPGSKLESLVLSPSGRQVAVCGADHNEVYLYDVGTGKLESLLRGHSAPATSVAYRPDGKQVATIGHDQTIRLWDPATGRELAVLRADVALPNLERYPLLAYNSDGSRIASSSRMHGGAGTSRLWDAASGKEIAVLGKWQDGVRPLAISPDGKRVAVGSGEYVCLCDAVTGRQLAVMGPHKPMVTDLRYSPDGKRIAVSASLSNAIHLWDGESGKEVAVLRGHRAAVISVLFSPDGSRLVSGSVYPDNGARLWDAATGRLLAVLTGHKNSVDATAFSPDGQRVVTASSDQTARLWDGRTGQLLAVLGGHTDRVKHVLFSPDGTRVVTASDDATLRLREARTGDLIGVLRGHGDGFPVECPPAFTPDGSRLVSGSASGTVRIWDMSLVERNGILRGHESYVYDVAFSPNGEQMASAAWDGTARLWDATTGRQTGLLKHDTGIITSVAYSRDGRRLATMERARGVMLWDVASQKPARDWRIPLAGWDPRASFNPAGTLLAAASAAGPVRLWDVAAGRDVARLEGHDKDSIDVAFHPDGNLLATTGIDRSIRLWDIDAHAPIAVLRGHIDKVWRVAFSADGKLLASGSHDKTICLWDAQTHKQLAVIPVGSIVYSVAFSPDGTRLAAGCRDNTVRLFDVASRQQVAELRGHTDYVHAVAWSPDGTRLVSGSGDFTVRIWDALTPAVRARPPDAYQPPRGYVCYRATGPVTIDGKLDDAAWKAAPWTDDFVDIEGDRRIKPRFRTRVKMLWDDNYLYIGAELEEPHVQGTNTRRDSYIFHEDNDFEVFLNPDGNNHHYAELEMNALNTVWDLRLKKPYRDGGKAEDAWDIPGLRTAVHVNGTVNNPRDLDKGWTLEIAIPWEIVRALNDKPGSAPRDGEQWRINFSRVQWRFDTVAGKYVRRKDRREDNWVWSPQGVVDMHQPETWGYVQFSTAAPGAAAFRPDPAGPAKHLLHRIYYAQKTFKKEHGRYARSLAELKLADAREATLAGPPVLKAEADRFRATADVKLPGGGRQRWHIREDSRVWSAR